MKEYAIVDMEKSVFIGSIDPSEQDFMESQANRIPTVHATVLKA